MKEQKKIYFDYAATTPIDKKVFESMKPYLTDQFGNASSHHLFGQKAMSAVDKSRDSIAAFLGCLPKEVIFTSGATASNNLAIQGLVDSGQHIITSIIEHPSVSETCQAMEERGVAVTYANVDANGLVIIDEIKRAINDNTVLISIMYVNNEIGTIQPIKEIHQLISKVNDSRRQKIYFHVDASQAVNYCDMKIKTLGADLLSISAHKIYGPKGIGLLFKQEGVPLKPLQYGGHQEDAISPGTLNVAGIVGLGKAIELVKENNNKQIKSLANKLMKNVIELIPNSQLNGDLQKRIPSCLNFSFKGVEGENIFLLLDQAGIAVSTGAACASGSHEPSSVLLALGHSQELALSSIRITLGKINTESEVDYLISNLQIIIEKLRSGNHNI
ncbi:MAG: cysteine desulfurase NifS [Parcubacteria group bacterium]|nr:cysteine desulfurase NifS [Parcubacteria group bacterium]